MAKNTGKVFESDWKKSIPDHCLLIRLPDPPHSFSQRKDTRFAVKNPCDYICYDTESRVLHCWELKTTKYKSMSFDDIDSDERESKMVKRHQIEGLQKFASHDNVSAGFVLNFRDEKNNAERTYFQSVDDFINMCGKIGKKSFNEIDLILNGAIKVNGTKKRVHYTWDVERMLEKQYNDDPMSDI